MAPFMSFGKLCVMDLPGHGENGQKMDLSLENLIRLGCELFDALKKEFADSIILVGHSLGGSIATHVAGARESDGLIVIDVVEGTALQALEFMEGIAKNR